MPRVLTGVKPTGDLHLGNFFGTMQSWPSYQADNEAFFFVADLHALNIHPDPTELRGRTAEMVAWLLAVGVDPMHARIFVESQIPEIAELFTILNNFVTMGELSRMTQYKDKSQRSGSDAQWVGLFEYPVLMASDILLMETSIVPIGDDQRQHLEITRDIALRFNHRFGETFIVPRAELREIGTRIMGLQQPERKMSKSDESPDDCIYLLDLPDEIRRKLKRAATDSGSDVKVSPDKPAISNLIALYALATQTTAHQVEERYEGKGYGAFKADLAEAIIELLQPVRQRYEDLIKDRAEIDEVIAAGRVQATLVAEQKLKDVKGKLGLLH